VELNWTTFVLEIINFLVLVWILKRFLYQPVLDVIAARRRTVEQQLAEAHATEDEARSLKEQYTGRLREWETERREARETLAHEIEQERARRLADVKASLEQEREKARVAEDRQKAEQERAIEQQALQQGARFSSRLLERAAGPDLEGRLVAMLIDDLTSLPDEQRRRLRDQWPERPQTIDVSSAFDLSDEQRDTLTSALHELADVPDIRFRRDEALVAGLRIEIGAWVLAGNVRDELRGFTELARAG
jgi:F-type H+-transporting ATPase subunit b